MTRLSARLSMATMLLVVTVGPVAAQFIDFQATQADLPLRSISQARLAAMGGLSLVVPDENNEINLSDFARNIAGVAEDKDSWSVEVTYDKLRQSRDYSESRGAGPLNQREVVTQQFGLLDAVYRNDRGRALGGSFRWDAQADKFRLGDHSKTRGPRISLLWNETFFDTRFGTSLKRWSDNEDVRSADVFSLRHFSEVWAWNLGLARRAFGLDLAAQIDLENVTINGRSRDPAGFHQDDFEWRRPAKRYTVSALLPTGGNLEAGVNFLMEQRDGREEVQISWSDRFPNNPGGFNFDFKVPTFDEEEDLSRAEARLLYRIGEGPRVGAYVRYDDFASDVRSSPNFAGSRAAGTLDQTSLTLGGGVGTSFASGALTVGVEGLGRFVEREETAPRLDTDTKSREVGGRLGAEWFPRQNLALRAGIERVSLDAAVDEPFSLQLGNTVAMGFGYVPAGGIYAIDGYVRFRDLTPEQDVPESQETDRLDLGLSIRLLY